MTILVGAWTCSARGACTPGASMIFRVPQSPTQAAAGVLLGTALGATPGATSAATALALVGVGAGGGNADGGAHPVVPDSSRSAPGGGSLPSGSVPGATR